MKKVGIYKIVAPDGKMYIGQSKDIGERIKRHKEGDCLKNRRIKDCIGKSGIKSLVFEVIEECDVDDLDRLEIHYISLYNTTQTGFNLSSGGKNPTYSDDSKKLMSSQRIGVKPTIKALQNMRIGRDKNRDKFISAMRCPIRKKKISEQKSKSLIVIDGVKSNVFKSVVEASKWLNIDKTSIAKFARGERFHKHLIFEYL